MKRITNFLMLLLLAMCGIGASAQTTVTLDGTSTSSGTYYRNGEAQTGVTWCAKWVSSGLTPEITLSVGANNMHSYQSDGFRLWRGGSSPMNYTLSLSYGYVIKAIELQFYNLSATNVTLSCNGTSATATSTSASDAVTLAVSDINSQSVVIALTASGNVGCVVPVFKVTYDAADVPPLLSDLANANSTKAYTLTTPRAFIHAESATATQFSRTMLTDGTADKTNPLHQWTFVTLGGKTYLYNVGAKKFASYSTNKSHDLVTSAPAYVTSETSTYQTDYPLVLKFTNEANTSQPTATLNMSAGGVMIDSWSTHDGGNVQQIIEVPNVTVAPEVYIANFTCSGGQLTSVYVDGTEVALGTDVVLTSGATVSSSAAVNAIESYNGYTTLAEALANLSGNTGSIDVALPAVTSTVTLNVLRNGTQQVKTVTIENVPENTVINVADALGGTPAYVSDITPATVTSTDADQTIDVSYTSSLPFAISEDPASPNATEYIVTLRSKYAHGNAASSTSVYDLEDDSYYWTFGGNEFDGVTVYNKDFGYMNVTNANNSVATFSTTPSNYIVSANSDGFSLLLAGTTNTYINESGSNGYVSTWQHANAATDDGSRFKVYTVSEAVETLIENNIDPYFTWRECVNALSDADATALQADYDALLAAPTYAGYLAFKAVVEGYRKVQPTEGYYLVLSGLKGFETKQHSIKAMYYNATNNAIAWGNFEYTAPFVMKLTAADASKYRLTSSLADTYLQAKAGAMTSDEASAMTFEVVAKNPATVALVYNANGGNDAALHAAGHSSGAGVSGALTGWSESSEASFWRLMPVNDLDEITLIAPEGVADGEEVMQSFVHVNDAQLPLTVGAYTITEDLAAGARLDTIATSQIAAGQGYIISGTKGKVVPLLPLAEVVDVPAGNLLVAGDGSQVSGGYILAYKKGEAEAKFWSINGLSVPANRAYLPEGAPTRGLENIFGGIGEDVTGINGITTGAENGAVYDLQGRRVNNATKGVYIINGKKVIK